MAFDMSEPELCECHYGPAPHQCFYKIGAQLGESGRLPRSEWPPNYVEDLTPGSEGLGTYLCSKCMKEQNK